MSKRCLICGKGINFQISWQFIIAYQPLPQEDICLPCLHSFKRIKSKQRCENCLKKLINENECSDCQHFKKIYPHLSQRHIALFEYNDFAQEWMKLLKVKGDLRVGKAFAPFVHRIGRKHFSGHVIVPVPSSPQSMNRRGFNHLEILLKGKSCKDLLLHKGLGGPKQSQKTKRERLKSPQPFQLNESITLPKNCPLLIVDDIYTTGTTTYHAKQLLYANHYTKVKSLSVFR